MPHEAVLITSNSHCLIKQYFQINYFLHLHRPINATFLTTHLATAFPQRGLYVQPEEGNNHLQSDHVRVHGHGQARRGCICAT